MGKSITIKNLIKIQDKDLFLSLCDKNYYKESLHGLIDALKYLKMYDQELSCENVFNYTKNRTIVLQYVDLLMSK